MMRRQHRRQGRAHLDAGAFHALNLLVSLGGPCFFSVVLWHDVPHKLREGNHTGP